MKKITTLLFTFIGVLAYSQSISITTTDSIHLEEVTENVNDLFEHKTYVQNENISATGVSWKIDSIYFPPEWTLSLCDIFACPIITDTTGTGAFTLPASEQGELKMGYTPNGIAGSTYVRVSITADGTTEPPIIMVYTSKITVSPTLGINKISENAGLSLYPNPVSNKLFLSQDAFGDVEKIEIYNVIGKKVYDGLVQNQLTTINTADFNKGVYIAKVFSKTNNLVYTQSFIKQ